MPPPQPRKRTDDAPSDGGDSPGLVVWVDGLEYRLDLDQVKHPHELALWHATKLTLRDLLNTTAWPPFMVAAVVFLARLQRGDVGITYDEVAGAIGWRSEFGRPDGVEDEAPAPEAHGAG